MNVLYEGTSADAAWAQALDDFQRGGMDFVEESRGGATFEVLNATFHLINPRCRWVISRRPPMNPAFAFAECFWMLLGRQDAALVNCWNPILPRYSGKGENYNGAYGYRLRKGAGFDQLARAYEVLRNNRASRQVVLQIWNPCADMPASSGVPMSSDVPCNLCSLLKVRNGKLEWTQILRSNDLFLGVPYNFVQFTFLQEIFASWLGLDVGSYWHLSNSLHIYETDWCKLSREEGYTGPTASSPLTLSWQGFWEALKDIEQMIDLMISREVLGLRLYDLVCGSSIPASYRNMVIVMAADYSRRLRDLQLAERLMGECECFLYRHLWELWFRKSEG